MPTSLDTDLVKGLLRSFKFEELFTELGWDHLDVESIKITVDHVDYELEAVAQKRGVQVFVCWAQSIPGATLRHKIDSRLTQHAHEHLLIFAEAAKSRQVWQWVAHEAGQPHFLRSFSWQKGQDGNVLTQRLAEIAVPISEEESIDLTTMTHLLKDALDRDKVTKRFYERFAKEREQFQSSIKGLSDDNAKWYTSVIVDRLMFIYFLQKQGFLAAGDRDYLRGKLDFIQFKGPDHYYGEFLRTLFFEGFAKPVSERSPEVQRMLGDIPYLNGGLFAPHSLEEAYGDKIRITDAAFEKLLTFFDQYQWTLDDRPLGNGNDNEINPDVLGYIFEKYVNQKQMGAYYTKEDITGYISQETIIPRLFDMVRAKYEPAFIGEHSVFTLLKDDPDTYIYASMRKGARDEDGNAMLLPDNIAQGLHDVSKRGDWNKPADAAYALPTEIWREVVARTQRYEEVRKHCADGDITDINDLITYNLDIRQFAQDAVAQSDDPVFVLGFYKALIAITILDPTCGSGAFLFAALNILERLYEVCLLRMEQFQQDRYGYTGQALRAVQQFDAILKEADRHSNRRYFILKSIVVHNLYGVDIMEEAVEICKLRLFLRLVAELKPGQPVEPLPDIDFNIKAGNTLVGYAHLRDAIAATQTQLFGESAGIRIQQKAEDLARLYRKMQDQQMVRGGRVTPEDKHALEERREQLNGELDAYLAYDYGVQTQKPKELQAWRANAQPFHWFAEFYGISARGGFDIIIGNPPYVEYNTTCDPYRIKRMVTKPCANLYAYTMEMGLSLLHGVGRLGMIVPASSMVTPGYRTLQDALASRGSLHVSSFSDQRGRLFDLPHSRLSIILSSPVREAAEIHTTNYTIIQPEMRSVLFECIGYGPDVSDLRLALHYVPRLGSDADLAVAQKLLSVQRTLGDQCRSTGTHIVYFTRKLSWYAQILDFIPEIRTLSGALRAPSELKELRFGNKIDADIALGALNSDFFYWYLTATSDCRNLNMNDIKSFPITAPVGPAWRRELHEAVQALMESFRITSESKEIHYRSKDTTLIVQCIYPVRARQFIDVLDGLFGVAYALTDSEEDYLRNHNIKYRMAADGDDEGDG